MHSIGFPAYGKGNVEKVTNTHFFFPFIRHRRGHLSITRTVFQGKQLHEVA